MTDTNINPNKIPKIEFGTEIDKYVKNALIQHTTRRTDIHMAILNYNAIAEILNQYQEENSDLNRVLNTPDNNTRETNIHSLMDNKEDIPSLNPLNKPLTIRDLHKFITDLKNKFEYQITIEYHNEHNQELIIKNITIKTFLNKYSYIFKE